MSSKIVHTHLLWQPFFLAPQKKREEKKFRIRESKMKRTKSTFKSTKFSLVDNLKCYTLYESGFLSVK